MRRRLIARDRYSSTIRADHNVLLQRSDATEWYRPRSRSIAASRPTHHVARSAALLAVAPSLVDAAQNKRRARAANWDPPWGTRMSVSVDPERLRRELAIRGMSAIHLAKKARVSSATVSVALAGDPSLSRRSS